MNGTSEVLWAWAPVWLLPLWMLLLITLLFVISLCGWCPWSKSSETHISEGAIHPKYYWKTGRFSWWLGYNNCLRVAFEKNGIYIRPIPPFHLFHPWLWLPWTSLVEIKQKTCLTIAYLVVHFRNTEGSNFYLYLPSEAISFLPQAEDTKTN